MSSESYQSFEPLSQPAEYFTQLLIEKVQLHEAILKKVVGEDVWARQREIEEFSHTSLTVDPKGLVDSIVSKIDADEEPRSVTSDQQERDDFVDAEDALLSVERTYLDGFVVQTDEPTPYLVKRNNPKLLVDPETGKRSLVRFLEFITTSPSGDVQREWYSSTAADRDYNLSLLAWERQTATDVVGVDLYRSPLDDEHKLILFMAIENLNDLYRRLLDVPDEELRAEIAL